METLSTTLISVVSLISEVKSAVELVSEVSHEKVTKSNKALKDIIESVKSIEKKITHSNGQLDSLHIKSNVLDNQIKKLDENQGKMITKLESIQQLLVLAKEIDTQPSEVTLSHSGKSVHVNYNTKGTQRQLDQNNNSEMQNDTSFLRNQSERILNGLQENREMGDNVASCDYLILSDSILQKILPNRFSPREKTFKRYIRGGAVTCTDFVKKNCDKINPKKIILHIGARDLQQDGLKREEFLTLFTELSTIWPDATTHVLPLMRRKDMDIKHITEANSIIINAASSFSNVKIMHCFHPTDNMYFDNVHLNTRNGVPALVRHLKVELNILPSQNDRRPKFQRNRPMRETNFNNNKRGPRLNPQISDSVIPPIKTPYNNDSTFPPTRTAYSGEPAYPQMRTPSFMQNQQAPPFQMPMPFINPWLWNQFCQMNNPPRDMSNFMKTV